jgi:hypothetical protein
MKASKPEHILIIIYGIAGWLHPLFDYFDENISACQKSDGVSWVVEE